MVRTTFELKGDRRMIANLRKLAREEPRKVGRALFEEGEDIMREAKRITPVATPELSGYSGGALRASGRVNLPKFNSGGVSVLLSFGGAAVPYAVYVHEIPPPPKKSRKGRSARHHPPTQWKFLEKPFNEAQVGMAERLARKLRTWLGR